MGSCVRNLEPGGLRVTVPTFEQMAEKFGWGSSSASGRRLKRLVLSCEQAKGIRIATRGLGRTRPLRGVTLTALLAYMPEHVPEHLRPKPESRARRDLDRAFRGYLTEIDENTRRVAREESEASIAAIVAPQLLELRDEIRAGDEAIQENLNALASRVAMASRKTA
jgi:hypothetical protein